MFVTFAGHFVVQVRKKVEVGFTVWVVANVLGVQCTKLVKCCVGLKNANYFC